MLSGVKKFSPKQLIYIKFHIKIQNPSQFLAQFSSQIVSNMSTKLKTCSIYNPY